MTFVQIIDYETTDTKAMDALMDDWLAATEGRRTVNSTMHTHDRDNPMHCVEIVEFPSYEEAMRNSELAETQAFAARMRALCSTGPSYLNLEVDRRD